MPTLLKYSSLSNEESKKFNPKTSSHDITATSGLLSPDGRLYPCEYGQHEKLLRSFKADFVLLEISFYEDRFRPKKWLHLCKSEWRELNYSATPEDPLTITQSQIDTIFDWCKFHKQDMPSWIKKLS